MSKARILLLSLVLVLVLGLAVSWAYADEPPKLEEPEENTDVMAVDAATLSPFAGSIEAGPLGPTGQALAYEIEPNGTPAEANPLAGSNVALLGTIYPNGDHDYFSFTAAAGDRVYAAIMTSFSAPGSTDSYLEVLGTDGTTVLEFDNDDGSFGSLSSSIAGTTLPAAGTYYLHVRHNSATSQLRPYHLHFQLQSGAPVPETEPNDAGQALPASGWVSGEISATTDVDVFTLSLNAGDTVYLSLDLDPERDATEWNGWIGLGVFNGFYLVANDAGTSTPDSEAFFMTVKDAGTYGVLVSVPTGGTTFGTYHLSVSVIPAAPTAGCTTYTSTDVPQTIPDGPGMVSSNIVVPGNPIIGDLDVSIELNHLSMPDLDAHLVSPAGNDNGLFTDIGSSTQTPMNLVLDDEAGIPIGAYTVVSGLRYTPELAYRLDWFDGEDAGGTWSLVLRDDLAANGGTLTNWSITICEAPPPPVCGPGTTPVTVYSSDFEANDGGFTHSGTADEWEWGLPSFIPITTCNSGTGCWKTDLDNTYNASSTQDLLSPNIDLTGLVGPVVATWSQRWHIESASFDHAFVDAQLVGGASPTRLWEWLGASMNSTVGNPSTTINESAGWGTRWADISSLAGQNMELRFHLDSDSSVQYTGLGIDDVSVTACQPSGVNPAISLAKTVGTAPGVCATTDNITVPAGTEVYYCYQAENIGDVTFEFHDLVDDQLGVLLDDFPYSLAPGALSPQVIVPETLWATTVNSATWTAVNALGSYTFDDSAPFNYIPINATGTALNLSDDGEANIVLPFPFTAFGVTSTDLRVANNGAVILGTLAGDVSTLNATLPTTSGAFANGPGIIPFWDDIDSDTGNVYWEVQGAAPNRTVIVEWYNRPHFSNIGSATFEVILYEGSNQIKFQYLDVDFGDPLYNNGVSATVGLNENGSSAVQYSFNQAVITDNMAILWSPAVPVSASASDSATVNVVAANIDVSPLSMSSTQAPNTTTMQTLTIANTGDSPLDWDIFEENTPVGPGPQAILYDNGPLITHPGGGAGGADASALQTAIGLNVYGFGHAVSSGFRVADDFTVPAGGWTITDIVFFAYQTGSTTTSTINNVNLRIWDGVPGQAGSNIVFGDTTTNRLTGTVWSNSYRVLDTDLLGSTRPIMASTAAAATFLPGGTYWLDWQSGGTLASGPWVPPVTILGQVNKPGSNALQFDGAAWVPLIDTGTAAAPQDLPFIINGLADCAAPADIPWASVNPTSGTTPIAGSSAVDVTFDSTGVAAGTYTGNLCVESNDPDPGPGNGTGLVIVPLELIVEAVPSISLNKTVGLTAGVCATTDSVTIPAGYGGTVVYYCYEVTNTGDVTLSLHDLNDSELGNIFTGLAYDLLPGTSIDTVTAGLEISATITQTTVNTGTWAAYNAGTPPVTASDTATVVRGAPTGVGLSGFGADNTAAAPLWLSGLLLLVLGGGALLLRRKTAR